MKTDITFANITVFGAGCVGSYLAGVLLKNNGQISDKITLVGRPSLAAAIVKNGLTISDYLGNTDRLTMPIHVVSTKETSIDKPHCDVLLITLKCTSIKESINDIATYISTNTVIVCLQNGLDSEVEVAKRFPNNEVLTGVVGFNSLAVTPSHFHRGTQGEVLIEQTKNKHIIQLVQLFNQQQLPCQLVDNIIAVRWGKLLLNLNNSINALAGLPLKVELQQRTYRKILAKTMLEALRILTKAKIKPEKFTDVSPYIVPYILLLPNVIFTRIANKMLAIDPLARSSMWHDIQDNKITEIDYINGAVVSLAENMGLESPINKQLVHLIKTAEKAQQGSPHLSADALKKSCSL